MFTEFKSCLDGFCCTCKTNYSVLSNRVFYKFRLISQIFGFAKDFFLHLAFYEKMVIIQFSFMKIF